MKVINTYGPPMPSCQASHDWKGIGPKDSDGYYLVVRCKCGLVAVQKPEFSTIYAVVKPTNTEFQLKY